MHPVAVPLFLCSSRALSGWLVSSVLWIGLAHGSAAGLLAQANADALSREMLQAIKEDLRSYVDPAFDPDAYFGQIEQQVLSAPSPSQAFGLLAQALLNLKDPHTFLLPPIRAEVRYGWRMVVAGDTCYVVAVDPGSDAAKQGLAPGDAILALGRYKPTRENLWQLYYVYYFLQPQQSMRVGVRKPDGSTQSLNIQAVLGKAPENVPASGGGFLSMLSAAAQERRTWEPVVRELDGGAVLWRLPSLVVNKTHVRETAKTLEGKKSLILDLRGNAGEDVETAQAIAGLLLDKGAKLGELKERKRSQPLAVIPSSVAFTGEVVVVVDSQTAGAAELLARAVQIHKRGKVVGDVTAGSVRRSRVVRHTIGGEQGFTMMVVFSDAELVPADGQKLEGVGVKPDEPAILAAEDLAAGRDSVLAKAASLVGAKLKAEEASALAAPRGDD